MEFFDQQNSTEALKQNKTNRHIQFHCHSLLKNVRVASDRHIAKALLSEVNAPFLYWDSIRGWLA